MSKIDFQDLTQPSAEESEALVAMLASNIISYASELSLMMRMTEEETVKGILLSAEQLPHYLDATGAMSKERVEELRQEVTEQSKKVMKTLEESGVLDKLKSRIEAMKNVRKEDAQ